MSIIGKLAPSSAGKTSYFTHGLHVATEPSNSMMYMSLYPLHTLLHTPVSDPHMIYQVLTPNQQAVCSQKPLIETQTNITESEFLSVSYPLIYHSIIIRHLSITIIFDFCWMGMAIKLLSFHCSWVNLSWLMSLGTLMQLSITQDWGPGTRPLQILLRACCIST